MTFQPPSRFNITDHFLGARIAAGLGDEEALRLDDRSLTYREVQTLTAQFAAAIRDLGVRQEERVLIVLPDGPEFVGAFFATIGLGGVAVMINPELPTEHLAEVMDYSRARATVVHAGHLPAVEKAAAQAQYGSRLLIVGGSSDRHAVFSAAKGEAKLVTVATHRDDAAIWLFSGGTTGAPKAVVQTHRSFANTTECYAKKALGYGPGDVTMSIPKLYFGYATGSNLLFPFSVGATAILFPEHPTVDVVFDKIRRHRPTVLVNVPSMVNQMVNHPDADNQDLSSLRFATSAGEALPESLYERWKETFGIELFDGLGTAEMWHIFISNRPGDVKPGTVGKVVPGFHIRICDEAGNEIPDGEVGRLWVRGGSRALGYWQNLDLTAQAFRGAWFVGGDLVSRDADGYITHRGRADDAIKVKGKWLRPQEVESTLLSHPLVKECCVIGVEDDAGLLKPVAWVVPGEDRPDNLEEELKQYVLEALEPYKHPRQIHFLDEMPKTHLGKIDRGRLRGLAIERPS